MIKNVYLLQLSTDSWDFLTVLWPSAKTYYELNGKRVDEYNWIIPSCEFYHDLDKIKESISKNPPDVFGVSLYVWNYERSLELCQWVKETYPNCVVITGGPQQFFKHNQDWFQKYSFIDASLPSEVYGELAICDILDHLRSDNTIDWNLVEQIAYPTQSRKLLLKSKKQTYKREFDWDYSPYQAQLPAIKEYLSEYNKNRAVPNMVAKFETTRGCPFNCTFCDWGGGIGTKMIFKSLDVVKQELDALVEFDIKSIFVTDSNFGTAGDRDVKIVQYIIEKNKESFGEIFQSLTFAGFAKVEKKFWAIEKILKLGAKFKLLAGYKVSQQSFHKQILDNVERVDVSADDKMKLAVYLRKKFNFPATVEVIFGLPGTTIDLWYQEFDKPYEYNMFVTAFEQFVSPEAETYSREYRDRWGLLTTKYIDPTGKFEALEFVTGHKDCTRKDYCTMLTIYMCYFFITQTGIYQQTISNLIKTKRWTFSNFLKKFYEECYPRLKNARLESFTLFEQRLADFTQEVITVDNSIPIPIVIPWEDTSFEYWGFLTVELFRYSDILMPVITSWLCEIGGDPKLINKETKLIINEQDHGIKEINWLYQGNYKKYNQISELTTSISHALMISYGNLLTVDQKIKPFTKLLA